MKKRVKTQFGFTLIEVLVASFIFASVLAVVYGLLNDTLISKKELELSLTINQQVKNANEILQSVMRQANGDFFTDGEFQTNPANPPTKLAHLFFVSNQYFNPIMPPQPATALNGNYLYVKTLENQTKKIYIFSLDNTNHLFWLEVWVLLANGHWSNSQTRTTLFSYYATLAAPLVTPFSAPLSVYQPSKGELPPMDLYVHLKIKAINKWKNTNYIREMDQTYVPLITSNPYL